jgi:hypothetical protein
MERRTCRYLVRAKFRLSSHDINGDGVDDYVLDYSKFQCGGDSLIYCGSAGCLTTVFASLPDGSYVKVLDENVRGVEFRKIKGRSAMILDLMVQVWKGWRGTLLAQRISPPKGSNGFGQCG